MDIWVVSTLAIVSIHVHIFVCACVFISLGYTPRSGMVGLYGNCLFSFIRNCQTIFQSSCTALYFYPQGAGFPASPHPCKRLLLSVFLILAILVSLRWYLIVVLTCVSFIANNIGHLFMCLFPYSFNKFLLLNQWEFSVMFLLFVCFFCLQLWISENFLKVSLRVVCLLNALWA